MDEVVSAVEGAGYNVTVVDFAGKSLQEQVFACGACHNTHRHRQKGQDGPTDVTSYRETLATHTARGPWHRKTGSGAFHNSAIHTSSSILYLQILLSRQAQLFVGMHGAGMTNAVW